jgi:hypothetical protein
MGNLDILASYPSAGAGYILLAIPASILIYWLNLKYPTKFSKIVIIFFITVYILLGLTIWWVVF